MPGGSRAAGSSDALQSVRRSGLVTEGRAPSGRSLPAWKLEVSDQKHAIRALSLAADPVAIAVEAKLVPADHADWTGDVVRPITRSTRAVVVADARGEARTSV